MTEQKKARGQPRAQNAQLNAEHTNTITTTCPALFSLSTHNNFSPETYCNTEGPALSGQHTFPPPGELVAPLNSKTRKIL